MCDPTLSCLRVFGRDPTGELTALPNLGHAYPVSPDTLAGFMGPLRGRGEGKTR